MPRYALLLEYDGTHYSGWQRQPDVPSVQGAVERAIFGCTQEEVSLTCAGRTDAGVHACGQVAHLDLSRTWQAERLLLAINAHLRGQWVRVLKVREVSPTFSARFDAILRHYRYRIAVRRATPILEHQRVWQLYHWPDIAAMREAASHLLGYHDFSSFRDTQCQARSPLRTLDRLDIIETEDGLDIEVSALSFLHHQVRIIVGTLADVGKGRYEPEAMHRILSAKRRCAAGPTAPAYGLYFMRVEYPEGAFGIA